MKKTIHQVSDTKNYCVVPIENRNVCQGLPNDFELIEQHSTPKNTVDPCPKI